MYALGKGEDIHKPRHDSQQIDRIFDQGRAKVVQNIKDGKTPMSLKEASELSQKVRSERGCRTICETPKRWCVPLQAYEAFLKKKGTSLKPLPPGAVRIVKNAVRASERGDFVEFLREGDREGWMTVWDSHYSGHAHYGEVANSKDLLHPQEPLS